MGKTEVRHMCREPHCRSKLPSPTGNSRDAFCARGCFNRFYRTRCLVCEQVIPRNAEHQRVCHRAKCRSAWRRKLFALLFCVDRRHGTSTASAIYNQRMRSLAGTAEQGASRTRTGRWWRGGNPGRGHKTDASALERALLGKLEAQRDFAAEYRAKFPDGVNARYSGYASTGASSKEEWCQASRSGIGLCRGISSEAPGKGSCASTDA